MLSLLLEIATVPPTGESAMDFTWLFVKMMGALVLVCVFAVVVLRYVVPRLGVFKKYSSNRYIEIIGRCHLDQKKHLYIVKVGSRYALIGASDHGVNLVMELKPGELGI